MMWIDLSYISNWGCNIQVKFLLLSAFEIWVDVFLVIIFIILPILLIFFFGKLLFIKVFRAQKKKINVIILQIIGALTSKQTM